MNWTYVAGSAGSFGDPTITSNAGGELLTWTNIGSIAPGATVIVPFTAQPTVAAEQTPGSGPSNLNTASESATAADQGGASGSADGAYAAGPNTANADLLVPALSVVKTPKNGTFTAGNPGAWSIKVANGGTGAARNVTVSDDLPVGDAFSSGAATASPSTGFSQTAYDSSGPTTNVTWTLTSIAAGASVTITVPTSVASNLASGATLNNTAQAQATEEPTPVSDTGNVTIATSAGVAVTNSAAPSPATAGGDLEYTINVTNTGPSDAQGVTLSDPLPASATFVAFDSGASFCSQSAGSINCSFGTLASGASQLVKVHVTLASSAPGSVSDTATVASTTTDPDSADNSATATVAAGRTADLALTDTANPTAVVQGQDASLTLTASNGGPSDAPNTVITDVLPNGLSFVSASAGCTNSSGTVTCVVGSLADGADAAFTVVTEALQVGNQVDAASVTSGAVDPDTSNNSADDGVTVGPAVDLAVADTGPATIAAGGLASYAWTVTNAGPSTGTGVSVRDVLAPGETFASVTAPAGWSCTSPAVGVNGTVTCSHAAGYPDGASDVLDLSVNVGFGLADQAFADAPSVSGNEADPDLSNNAASVSTAVGPAADLSLTDSPSPTSVVRGDQFTYTLVAANAGPDDATGVVVTELLPAGLSFVSASPGCVNSAGVVTCSLGSVADDSSQTATIVVKALADGDQVDSASVSADQVDPDIGNNSAGGTLMVGPAADLAIAGTGPVAVAAGASASYAWTVTNDGLDDGTGVALSDVLPAGMTFVSAVSDQGSCSDTGQAISCSLGSLADGSSATVTVVASASPSKAGQALVNTVSVSGHQNDPNQANNNSSVSTIVGPAADMSVTDTANHANPAQQQQLTYTLSYANRGPSTAHHVIVIDTLPAGLSFKSVGDANCVDVGVVVTCDEGAVASGATGTIQLVVSADGLGVQHDAATVSADEPDPDASNDSASADVTVGPTADLTLTKTTSAPDVAAGGLITYSLSVQNAGPSAATDVVFTDPLPAGESIVDATVPGGSCAEILSTVTCTIGQVDVHDRVAATLLVRPGVALADSTVVNTATVAADEDDTNSLATQTSSAPVSVGPATDQPVVTPSPVQLPAPNRCPRPTGRLTGQTLGRLALGMTRAHARERLPRFNITENNFDNFCLHGGWGIRTGYPSALLRRSLSKAAQAAVRGRVVLALTANPYYDLRGIRPGATQNAAIAALDLGRAFHVGLNYWYLAPNGSSTAVLKVRNGTVQEIGIAARKLTDNRKSQNTFINSFS